MLKNYHEKNIHRFTISGEVAQTSTRGDGKLMLSENFYVEDIDYSTIAHLTRHLLSDSTPGSKFHKLIRNDDDIERFIRGTMSIYFKDKPINLDVHGRCELTFTFDRSIGTTGVITIDDAKKYGLVVYVGQREKETIGIRETLHVGGTDIPGVWLPEMEKDSSGRFVVKRDDKGNLFNERFKFQPDSQFCRASALPETNKLTVIFERSKNDGVIRMVTAFPGDNAPAQPVKMDKYGVDTVRPDSPESIYWKNHALLILDSTANQRP